jgi:Rps23 Pro-64 3,4-dihydroxylase Tpa1-like proline 4-hydroxylase
VIPNLVDDWLLRRVRAEVQENVHFTPKETDIYKIHQSGDLANLDGLENEALAKLPSLLKLRDALYSPEFRKYVATVTGAGKLSGRKTDMAINVYTPGCHLLCHDDVIGSRRVSYILYLTDPDIPWQPPWGGALRLYPTTEVTDSDGKTHRTPEAHFSKVIPPAWNQLSFFAVQPGLSFHDVEEVYHAETQEQLEKQGGRIRMAISGWYHIPQLGEEGYIEGEEARLAEKSSLAQLQGKADEFDFPKYEARSTQTSSAGDGEQDEDSSLEAEDIEFLLKYMAPTYLTPDTMEGVTEHFAEESSVTLPSLLHPKFAARLKAYIEEQESIPLSEDSAPEGWKIARPPHKHKFLYLEQSDALSTELTPIQELLDVFLPSSAFRKWLQIATECEIEDLSVLARRFRRGADYALATSHEGKPRLEICLGVTTTTGWGDEEEEEGEGDGGEEEEEEEVEEPTGKGKGKGKAKATPIEPPKQVEVNGKDKGKGKAKAKSPLSESFSAADIEAESSESEAASEDEEDDVGGHEVYMAADTSSADDAAIYKHSELDDGGVLFSNAPSWNKLSIVLRDEDTLKFVKYVSRKAAGSRWDVVGVFGVKEGEEGSGDEGDDVEGDGEANGAGPSASAGSSFEASGSGVSLLDSETEEEEFKGFSDSDEESE